MEQPLKGKEKEWAKVVAQAWIDEAFKAKLLADPRGVLKAAGIDLPENMKINITEAEEGELNLTIPPKPEGFPSALSEEELQHIAGGIIEVYPM